jgi:DNA-binding NtrC family response regulator
MAIPENIRVLLVDDDHSTAELIGGVIGTMWGHRVVLASSFSEAQEAIANAGAFDVLLTDLQLPDGHGFDIARLYRRHNPAGRTIVASGGIDGVNIPEDIAGQAKLEMIIKPYDPFSDLLHAMERLYAVN